MRWRRNRDEQGAVALEAALVIPILFVLLLGIVEFSFVMRDYVVVVSDTRVGARIAAAGANFGPADCKPPADGDPASAMPCTSTSAPKLAQAAARAIQTSGSAMPMDNINYIYIYRANDAGFPDGGSGDFSSCPTSSCVKFVWRKRSDEFRYESGAWSSVSISACFPGRAPESVPSGGLQKRSLERVGVYVNTTHKALTGLFFEELTLDDHAVMNFEPLASSQCGEGMHS